MAGRLSHASLTENTTSIIAAVMIALGPVTLALYTPGLPKLVEVFGATPSAVRATVNVRFLLK